MEALVTLLADRCEARRLRISSNPESSQWIEIFRSLMTTMAAIVRLVPRSIILKSEGANRQAEMAAEKAPKAKAQLPATNDGTTVPNPAGLKHLNPIYHPSPTRDHPVPVLGTMLLDANL